ncbi:MAG TPA: hypothetical protein VF306_20360 [Pirellulales bacterium]
MSSTIKEFDLQAKGVVKLVECWKQHHAAVRAVWKIEDLVNEWLRLSQTASELFAHYCEHAQFPNSSATFSYFISVVEEAARCGAELDDIAGMFETQGYQVTGADKLRERIDQLREIVSEDRFATDAAFQGGALDEWD